MDRPKRFLCKRVSLYDCVTDEASDSDLESREEAKGWEPVMKRFSALMFLIPFCIYGKKELGFGATPHITNEIIFDFFVYPDPSGLVSNRNRFLGRTFLGMTTERIESGGATKNNNKI